MLKRALQKTIGAMGYELCHLCPDEMHGDTGGLDYKQAQLVRAIGVPPRLSVAASRALALLVAATDADRPIVELGTQLGWTTLMLALCKAPGQRLITVDDYAATPLGLGAAARWRAVRERLADALDHHAVVMLRRDRATFFREYDGGPPALVFRDDTPTFEATCDDLQWARRVGATTIVGAGHDVEHAPELVRAVTRMGGPREVVDGLFLL